MADSYDAAATQIDENKRAMLAAMAAGGTAAVQAHQRAQADVAAQQAAAVQGALAGAASRNAPGNLLPQLEQTVADPYRRYQADLAANQAYGAAAAAARQAANESYFAQAKAAIPALRNASQIAAAERAQKEAEARGQGGFDTLSDSELRSRLTGYGALRRDDAIDFTNNLPTASIFGLITKAMQRNAAAPSAKAYGREAGLQAGLDPARVAGVMYEAPAKPKAATKIPQAERRSQTLTELEKKYGTKSNMYKATQWLLSESSNLADALEGLDFSLSEGDELFLTPGGKKLSRRAIAAWLKRYYS